jgi:archaellum component FlaF (FlaF/FlaG flagellin family)
MYLEKKTYISIGDRNSLKVTNLTSAIDPSKIKYIVEEVGCWRKANAIHKWFVENVQKGNDDCKEYYVSVDKMKELLGLVNKVLKASKLVKGKIQNGSKFEKGKEVPIMEDGEYIKDPSVAEELLPTTSGFFYGSTSYDEYYIQDLKDTKKILEEAIKDSEGDFYYNSSW